jgi:hypothetical protein
MPKKGTKRSGFRKLRKTMKKGGKDESPSNLLDNLLDNRPYDEVIAFGIMVLALIIGNILAPHFNWGGGEDSPTRMLKQLPPNFLNSEGQLNILAMIFSLTSLFFEFRERVLISIKHLISEATKVFDAKRVKAIFIISI